MKRFLSPTLYANIVLLVLAFYFDKSDFYVDPLFFTCAAVVLNLGLHIHERS